MTAVRQRPLTADERRWVDRTRDGLSIDQKIAQLFNLAVVDTDPAQTRSLMTLGLGGFHRFPAGDAQVARAITCELVAASAVPPLISGDIEGGGAGLSFATPIPNQMGLAACDDPVLTGEIVRLVAREIRALGFNWSFTPVVDINHAFRSTVVGTRSFGSDPARILAQARAYVAAMQGEGLAATAKHWPGEGFDDRDQHLVTTVNPLDMGRWHAMFGAIYRTLIDDGLLSIMAGHIALPAYAGGNEPASVSRALNVDLLRGELGFEGLLTSDATVMGGLTGWIPRADAVPAVIAGGCDMFLFSRDAVADMAHMKAALRDGRLSEARVEEALTRVLTLKALLGLHRHAPLSPPIDAPAHLATARQAAARSITLVKDRDGLLPIDPARHRRIVLFVEPEDAVFLEGARPRVFDVLVRALEDRGFVVRAHDPDRPPSAADADLLLYLVGRESEPVIGSNRIDWVALHGGVRKGMARYWTDIPCAMISFGHPYLLYEAPNVPAYINAYSAIPTVQAALVAAMTGEIAFAGRSPVSVLDRCRP